MILISGAQPNCKEPSTPIQIPVQQNKVINENSTNVQPNFSLPTVPAKKQSNNNNKGENGLGLRRGKSNSESKVQAARNKHKNCQNKEKNNVRASSQSESNYSNAQSSIQNKTQSQDNRQNEIRNFSTDSIIETEQKCGSKQKIEQSNSIQDPELKLMQQINDLKINGVVQNGDYSQSDRDVDSQRERSTPASTISSSDDSNTNQQIEHLIKPKEENDSSTLLGKLTVRDFLKANQR